MDSLQVCPELRPSCQHSLCVICVGLFQRFGVVLELGSELGSELAFGRPWCALGLPQLVGKGVGQELLHIKSWQYLLTLFASLTLIQCCTAVLRLVGGRVVEDNSLADGGPH